MTKFPPQIRRTLFLAFGLLMAHSVHAADASSVVPTENETEAAEFSPGTKCVVTADLECEIREIKDDTVCIQVTALQEAEQGVPMLQKLPYTNRLFKNAGTVRTETDVILAIPRDRIAVAKPRKDQGTSDESHVQQAVQHLNAAGLEELAEQVQRHVERQARKRESANKRKKKADNEQRAASPDGAASDKPLQVLVELEVIELSRSKLRAQGIDFHLSAFDQAPTSSDSKAGRGLQAAMASRIVEEGTPVRQLLDRLREAGVAKTLAEPTVVTLAGRPASFHSGGEFPVPVPQDDGQIVMEYREFGTHVDLLPIHLGDGKLRLEFQVVVSELDSAHSVTVGDMQVPSLRSRSVDTAAELTTGQTLIISGLVQTRSTEDRAKDLEDEQEEVELLLLATPRLVDGTVLADLH